MAKILKPTQTREVLGTVVDTQHEGITNKRPTEKRRLDDWAPVEPKSPGLFQRVRALLARKSQLTWDEAEREVLRQPGTGSSEGKG